MPVVFSWGPGPWLLGAEIFPMRARAKGMALSNMSNWVCNFIIAFITPPLFSAIHGGYYFILVASCIISGIVVFFVYPETAHKTLEELNAVFKDKVPAGETDFDIVARAQSARSVATGNGWLEVPPPRRDNAFSDSSSTLQAVAGPKEEGQSDAASKLSAN